MIEEKPTSQHADADDKYGDEKRTQFVDSQPLVRSSDAQKGLGTNPASKEATSKMEEPLKKIERHTLMVAWAGLIVASFTGVIFYRQFKEMQTQTGILNDQAKQAARDANRQIDLTQKQMLLDERAWIGVENIKEDFEIGKRFIVYVTFRNVGRTPAEKVILRGVLRPVKKGEKFALVYPPATGRSLIIPNGAFHQNYFGSDGPLNEMQYNVIKNGQWGVYLYGKVTYDDIFSKHHWLTFCSFYSPERYGFNACEQGNDAGDYE